jgi:hypothetical protein
MSKKINLILVIMFYMILIFFSITFDNFTVATVIITFYSIFYIKSRFALNSNYEK